MFVSERYWRIAMNDEDILTKAEEARQCMKQAVHDELVKKAAATVPELFL